MEIESEEINIKDLLQKFSDTLPHFPDGRIDYTNSKRAPVLNCFVEYQGKILLLKRSKEVGDYQEKWNSVTGYIDEVTSIKEKIMGELREELGLSKKMIKDICIAPSYELIDQEIDRTWIIIPCLARLNRLPVISLDWEHTDYRWVTPKEIKEFSTTPNLENSLKIFIS
ncbi:MAG: NUDIX domain-containing protein [Candidatus Pacebacteria bacterium]|nr:NUDIX domain-containing protein [Candidatus Paceibacterota bacterium]